MRVVCAWCEEEGNPSFLDEKAPWNDPQDTSHGLCAFHKHRVLKEVEAKGDVAGPTHLFIVRRDDPDLYEWARQEFVDVPSIRVLLDRRVRRVRRWRIVKVANERRSGFDRRKRPGIDQQIRRLGYAAVEIDR